MNALVNKTLVHAVAPGVATGDQVQALFDFAKRGKFAYPAVNVVGTNSINATLEAASLVNSPVIVQLSHSGAAFFLGKGVKVEGHERSILGAIAAAHYVHAVASAYGVDRKSTRLNSSHVKMSYAVF